MAASVREVTAQDDAVDGELTGLIRKIALARSLDQYEVFCECVLEASVWVHQGRLAKRDMVDRFMQVADAYGLITDYGVEGIQNVLASTLREAAAIGQTLLSNGHDNESLDKIVLRQDANLPALSALPASHGGADQGITGTWAEPDWTILDDRRGELPKFPTDTFSARWQDWLGRAARGAGATEGHVAVPLLAIASSLIGTARRVRASSSWSEPCTMWTAVVGYSGMAKTPGIDLTKRAVAQIEKDRKLKNGDLQRQIVTDMLARRASSRAISAMTPEAVPVAGSRRACATFVTIYAARNVLLGASTVSAAFTGPASKTKKSRSKARMR